MRVEQARRLKELERENTRLKKIVADLSLDNAIRKEVSRGNSWARPGGGSHSCLHCSSRLRTTGMRGVAAVQSAQKHRHIFTSEEERLRNRIVEM
jgi:hypothetical protein